MQDFSLSCSQFDTRRYSSTAMQRRALWGKQRMYRVGADAGAAIGLFAFVWAMPLTRAATEVQGSSKVAGAMSFAPIECCCAACRCASVSGGPGVGFGENLVSIALKESVHLGGHVRACVYSRT